MRSGIATAQLTRDQIAGPRRRFAALLLLALRHIVDFPRARRIVGPNGYTGGLVTRR
jgi:hypothetical protein